MKLEYIVVYENILDKFNIGHLPDQGQGHGVHLPQNKLSGPITQLWHKLEADINFLYIDSVEEVHIFKHRLYISALEQARVLILGRYVLLGVINTIYKHCHA